MRKKALTKEFFVSIKKTYNRFISICLIVMLGTSFFAGVKATEPDMQKSADIFFDDSQLMDIRVLSTLGLTEEDVTAISAVEGVESATPVYTYDVLTEQNETQHVLKLMSVTDNVNKITVMEGQMPQTSGECLADWLLARNYGYQIGDTITVTSGNDTAIEDIVNTQTFTIVGFGKSSYYLDLTRDSSSIGNGSMSGFLMIPGEDFSLSAFTEIDVLVDGAKALDCYGYDYENAVDKVTENIKAIAGTQCELRYAQVTEDAQKAIDDAEAEVADGEQQLADAKQELTDGRQQLDDAKAEVADGKSQLSDAKTQMDDGRQQLADAKAQVADGETQLTAAKIQLADGQNQIAAARQQLADGEAALESYSSQLESGRTELMAAKTQLDDAKSGLDTLAAGIDTMEATLNDKQAELDAAETTIKDGRTALEAGRAQIDEYRNLVTALNVQIDAITAQMSAVQEGSEAWQALNAQLATLTAQRDAMQAGIDEFDRQDAMLTQSEAELAQGQAALDEKWSELDALKTTYSDGLVQYEAGMQAYEENLAALTENEAALEAQKQTLTASKQTLEAKAAELSSGAQTIADNEASLISAKHQIAENEQKLIDAQAEIDENEQKLTDAEAEIAENEQKLVDGQAEYDEAYEENHQKLEDAKADIAQAKLDLADVEVPEWYVLDRNYITTCVAYAQDSERIGNIGNVFPVIFFLVAALVSLTTMTRMVEEERVQIGTLKALGYSKTSIAAKYVLYAFFATVIGGVIGTLIGQVIFPSVIMNAYKISYATLTEFVTPMHLKYSLISMIAAVVSTTVATIAACYKELLAAPAELMRPAAPKIGKRVLLERMTFIWKHLNFSNKAAVRNLFRYKKRLFMTVLGIGGCMGLLLVGFGVKDSIMTIGDRQFNDIHTYQAKITLADVDTMEQKQEVLDSILSESTTKTAMLIHESTVDTCDDASGEGERSAYLFVPSDISEFGDYVALQKRGSQTQYTLDDEGVIISEKLASLLNVSEGDDIYLEISDMNYKPVKIEHIVENYFYHYVYMTPTLYEQLYGEAVDYEEIFVVNQDAKDFSYENAFSEKYLDMSTVSGITYTRTMSDRIESMITSMNVVIYVLVVSAGLLAFVVLYNLNNINISERQRELATLKVLGFYDGEVSMYVFRENIMLTVLGTIFGIFFGMWLHRFVILTAEIDIMMFGRQIYMRSYIYSILLTLAFSIIVNIVMHWKMKKIDMIESLKSVE